MNMKPYKAWLFIVILNVELEMVSGSFRGCHLTMLPIRLCLITNGKITYNGTKNISHNNSMLTWKYFTNTNYMRSDFGTSKY